MLSPKQKRKLHQRYGPPVVDDVVQGWVAFELSSTHGIPEDVIEEILEAKGMTLDWEDYHRRMDEFRQLSRTNSKPMGLGSLSRA